MNASFINVKSVLIKPQLVGVIPTREKNIRHYALQSVSNII